MFINKYKKLLNDIKDAKENKRRLYLENGVVLNFNDQWEEYSGRYFHPEYHSYYLITRKFPTGNKKMELVRYDGGDPYSCWLPEFTTHIMKLDVKPCERNY